MADQFLVVAYDIADDRRRTRVVKILEGCGLRANYSVFECLVKRSAVDSLKKRIGKVIDDREDSVLYYELCANCVDRRSASGWRPPQQVKEKFLLL